MIKKLEYKLKFAINRGAKKFIFWTKGEGGSDPKSKDFVEKFGKGDFFIFFYFVTLALDNK